MELAVAQYIHAFPLKHRALFDRIHKLILDACPDATVTLSYKMPTYTLGDRRLHCRDLEARRVDLRMEAARRRRFHRAAPGASDYAGSRPIRGYGPHHYRFHVFALDVSIPEHVTTASALLDRMPGTRWPAVC